MAFVEQALARLRAGDFGEAEALCNAVLADQAQRPDALHILGLVAHRRGDHTQALAFMKDAVSADPTNGDRRLELGLLAFEVGAHYDAVAHLEALIAGCGEVPQALNCLGNALAKLGQSELAIDRLERAVSAAPQWARAWHDLAQAYRVAARPMAAARALEGAYRHSPEPQTLLALGEVLAEAGNLQRANAYFKRLVRQDPGHVQGWVHHGITLRRLGQAKRALRAHREAVAAAPHDPLAQLELARTELLVGEFRDAFERVEWRKRLPDFKHPGQPWNERPLTDAVLTVYADGDLGETIALSRFVPPLCDRARAVRFAVQPELLPLFRKHWCAAGSIDVATLADVQPSDTTVGILSLPHILALEPPDCAPPPYLHVTPAQRQAASNPPPAGAATALAVGLHLTGELPGEHGDREARRPRLELPSNTLAVPLPSTAGDGATGLVTLSHTLANCELVVTDDELTAHLAGALGLPLWVLIPHGEGVLFGRDGNNWYRDCRVYRSNSSSGWRETLCAIHAALEEEAQVTESELE